MGTTTFRLRILLLAALSLACGALLGAALRSSNGATSAAGLPQADQGALTPVGHFSGWLATIAVPSSGDYLYLGEGSGFTVYDVADKAHPRQVAGLPLDGEDVSGIALVGSTACLVNGAGLRIFSLANPIQPVLVGGLDLAGADGIVVVGSPSASSGQAMAYVAGGQAGLLIVDVSNPVSPTLRGTYNTPGHARTIQVVGDTAYIADQEGGLQIISVSDPALPTLLGVYDTPGIALDVQVVGSKAYIADGWGSGLQILDVSNPISPTRLGSYLTPGTPWDVEVVGTIAYVTDHNGGLLILNVSNPASPILLATVADGWWAETVRISGSYAYVGSGEQGLRVLNVSNPASPVVLGSYERPSVLFDVAMAGAPPAPQIRGESNSPQDWGARGAATYAYAAGQFEFWTLDMTDPSLPRPLGKLEGFDGINARIAASGTLAYVAQEYSGLQIISAADPLSPTVVGGYAPPDGDHVHDVFVLGRYAYLPTVSYVPAAGIAGGWTDGWLRIVDVSNPVSPTLVPSFDTPGDARRVAVAKDVAYLADGAAGLRVLNVGDPLHPTEQSHVDPPAATATADAVIVVGDRAFVGHGRSAEGWLQMLDVSNPASPVVLDTYHLNGPVNDIAAHGSDLFLSVAGRGIAWLQVNGDELQLAAEYSSLLTQGVAYLGAGGGQGIRPDQAGLIAGLMQSYGAYFLQSSSSEGGNPPVQEPNQNPDNGAGGQIDPVYLHSGELHVTETDLVIPGRGVAGYMDYQFIRSYRSRTTSQGTLGWQWQHNYDRFLVQDGADIIAHTGPGRSDRYASAGGGNFTSPAGFYTVLTRNADGSYALAERDGMVTAFRGFDGSSTAGKMTAITDRAGNTLSFTYDAQGRLATVIDTLGRTITYAYNAQGFLATVEDFMGRRVSLTYDANGDLVAVTGPAVTGTPNGNDFPAGKTMRYTYSSGYSDPRLNHNLLTATAPNEVATGGPPYLVNTYGTDPAAYDFDRVIRQVWGGTNASGIAAGGVLTLSYQALNPDGDPANLTLPRNRTVITDRAGNVTEYWHSFDGHRLLLREYTNRNVRPGDPDYYETSYEYNADGELTRVVYPEGNSLVQVYDSSNPDRRQQGNLLERRQVADAARGGGNPLVTRFTYEPRFNQVKMITDPRGNDASYVPPLGSNSPERYRTAYTYDYEEATLGDINGDGRTDQARGALVRVQRPTVLLSDGVTQTVIFDYWYNDFGQLTREIDPEGSVTDHEYYPENDPDGDGQNLTPGRNTITGGYPKAVTRDSATSPRRTTSAPPAQIRTGYTYDRAGNLTGVTDGRDVQTTYVYNQLNQVVKLTLAAAVAPAAQYLISNIQQPAALDYERYLYYDPNDRIVREDVENVAPELDANRLPTGNQVRDAANPFLTTTYQRDILTQVVTRTSEISATVWTTLAYRYDGNGNVAQVIYPLGNTETTTYDERNLPYQRTFGANDPATASTVSYTYDGNGNLTRYVDGRGGSQTHPYDGFDRPLGSVDALGNVTRISYDPMGNAVARRFLDGQEGRNSDRSFTPDLAVTLTSERFLYDEMNRVYRSEADLFTVDPTDGGGSRGGSETRPYGGGIDGSETRPYVQSLVRYDRLGRQIATTDDNGNVTRFEYDGAGRLVGRTDALGNTEVMTLDANGNVVQSVRTDRGGGSGNLAPAAAADVQTRTWFVYDALNRLVRRTDALGQTYRYLYDSRGNHVFESDAQGALINDPLGLYPGQINDHGDTTRRTYDGLGRITRTTADLRTGGAWTADVTEDDAYDGDGRLVAVRDDNGNATRYAYDSQNRLLTRTYADGTVQRYTYDRNGNVIAFQDADGNRISSAYDALNRLTRVDVQRATATQGTTLQTFSYDGLGRWLTMTDNNDPADPADDSAVSFRYNSQGRTVAEIQNGQVISSTYDGVGNRLSLTYPGGQTINQTHDALNRLDTVQAAGSATPIADYDTIGPYYLLRRTYGNGIRLSLGYDAAWRKTSVTERRVADGQLLAGFSYAYDRVSNRRYEQRAQEGGEGDAYLYDSLSRVTEVRYGLADPAVITGPYDSATSFTLDGLGNRQQVTADGTTTPYLSNSVNAYTAIGGVVQTHDANGNLTDDGRRTYRYDFANRLVAATVPLLRPVAYLPLVLTGRASAADLPPNPPSTSSELALNEVKGQALPAREGEVAPPSLLIGEGGRGESSVTIQFKYDALGRRVAKVGPNGTTRYLYDGLRVIAEQDQAGATLATYVYGAELDEVLTMQRGGHTYYYHRNSLGSVVALSDESGNVVERYTYDAYGAATVQDSRGGSQIHPSSVGNPYLFTGQRYDAETGLYDYRARAYDPARGRFLQRDPSGYTDGLNLYTYTRDNPLNFIDPTGRNAADPAAVQINSALLQQTTPGTVNYISLSTGEAMQFTQAELANLGMDGLQTIYNQLSQASQAADQTGNQQALSALYPQMQTVYETMGQLGGQPSSEPMSGWEQTGEFFGVLAQELEIWNWMGDEAWEHNPLLIAETYGGWEADAAWAAAYTSAAAAVSALGLIGLEAAGISSIGSTPLWGGGTQVTSGLVANPFPNLSTSIAIPGPYTGTIIAPEVAAAYYAYTERISSILLENFHKFTTAQLFTPEYQQAMSQVLNIAYAAAKVAFGFVMND